MLHEFGQRQQELLTLLLYNKSGLTLDNLATSLHISRTAVLQHITALRTKGYVAQGTRAKTGGRPVQNYVLTDQGMDMFPKRYAWFTQLLLDELKEQFGSDALKDFFNAIAAKLAKELQPRFQNRTPEQQVEELRRVLSELGYHTLAPEPDAEAPDAADIRACHCVYHELAHQHREVCQLDIALMQNLLGRTVDHTRCMARGDSDCRFKIGEPPGTRTNATAITPENR